jgi:hypothetical protein
MAQISLRTVPDETHREIKRIQLDREDLGEKKSLEEIYIELIHEGLKHYQKKSSETKKPE